MLDESFHARIYLLEHVKYEIMFSYNSSCYFVFRLANLRKQRNAFAPNFVHSLDSTHMMLTSLHCEQKDVSFASVHDCFWTHPATVDKMNRICREQFVTLYQKPILNNLRNHFLREYGLKDSDLKPLPEEGSLDINEVLKSEYFFS